MEKNKDDRMLTVTPEGQQLTIKGRFLVPEGEGYLDAEENFFKSKTEELKDQDFALIVCEIEYLNSLARRHFHLFLEKLRREGINQTIIWKYEEDDEDIHELGKHYEDILKGYAFQYYVTLE